MSRGHHEVMGEKEIGYENLNRNNFFPFINIQNTTDYQPLTQNTNQRDDSTRNPDNCLSVYLSDTQQAVGRLIPTSSAASGPPSQHLKAFFSEKRKPVDSFDDSIHLTQADHPTFRHHHNLGSFDTFLYPFHYAQT